MRIFSPAARAALAAIALLGAAVLFTGPASAQQYQGVTSQMSDVQRNALKDGCWKLFNNDGYRRQQCLNGDGHWHRALREGCEQRYSGNSSKYNNCMDMSRLGSYGYDDRYGNNSYGGQQQGYDNITTQMTEIQRNALKDGCWKIFKNDGYRRQQCLNGDGYWNRALKEGCYQRYNGNTDKLYPCLDTSRISGGYSGGGYDNRYGGNRYGNQGYDRDYDGYGQQRAVILNEVQRNALEDGCQRRYSYDRHRYQSCMNGEGNWQAALEDGCFARYAGNNDKLRRCLDY